MPRHTHLQKLLRLTRWPVRVEATELSFLVHLTPEYTRRGEVKPACLIWNQSDWGFVGNRWWHLCLQAPREVGAISAPRKHASVSWMKLFWPKPGHPTRLERETLPPLFTLDCSPLSCWVPSSYTFKIPFFHQNPTHPPRPSSHAAFALTSLASPLRAMLSFLCAL